MSIACRRGASRSMGPCSWPCPTRWASCSPSSGSVIRFSSEGSTASSGARARTTSTTSRVRSRHRKLWPQQATTTTMTTKRRSSSSSRRSRTRAPATRSPQLKDLFAMKASSPLRHPSRWWGIDHLLSWWGVYMCMCVRRFYVPMSMWWVYPIPMHMDCLLFRRWSSEWSSSPSGLNWQQCVCMGQKYNSYV